MVHDREEDPVHGRGLRAREPREAVDGEVGRRRGGNSPATRSGSWRLVDDGHRTGRDLVLETGLVEFDVAKALYGLIQAGFIRLHRAAAGTGSEAAEAEGWPRLSVGGAYYRAGMFEDAEREYRLILAIVEIRTHGPQPAGPHLPAGRAPRRGARALRGGARTGAREARRGSGIGPWHWNSWIGMRRRFSSSRHWPSRIQETGISSLRGPSRS
jgi:hypothetical protein